MKLAQILFYVLLDPTEMGRGRWRKMRKVWNEKPLESGVEEHDKI